MSKRFLLAFAIVVSVAAFFQNCGEVGLRGGFSAIDIFSASGESVFYLKPLTEADGNYRAVLFIDMSRSMINAPCIDSSDTLLTGIQPHPNCLGPSGVDVDDKLSGSLAAKRFRISLAWLNQLQTSIDQGTVKDSQIRIFVAPFSNGEFLETGTSRLSGNGPNEYFAPGKVYVNPTTGVISYNGGLSAKLQKEVKSVFVNVADAKTLLLRLWAIQVKAQSEAAGLSGPAITFPPEIPTSITDKINAPNRAALLPTMRTSVPYNALESMNLIISQELTSLTAEQRSKTHFEVVLFSDGVPKPHPNHIEAIVNFVWATKSVMPYQRFSGYFNVDLKSCISRCSSYLKAYAEAGEVNIPESESHPAQANCYNCDGFQVRFQSPKCEECFIGLRCWNYDPNASYSRSSGTTNYCGGYQDSFRKDIVGDNYYSAWGDWVLNNQSQIFGKISSTVNIFKRQFPEVSGRLSFVRLDSPDADKRVVSAELEENLNWFIKAKKLYPKIHRHISVVSPQPPFDLFSEVQSGQTYRVGAIYAVNLNARVGAGGQIEIDSDSDGVSDADEIAANLDPQLTRSNGQCLDSIRMKNGSCLTLGCDPQLDSDNDGLNQCEERTLGLDENDFDSDGDRIPDGLEALFGLDGLGNDQLIDLNSDGQSNYNQFRAGVRSTVRLSNVAPKNLVSLKAEFVGTKNVRDDLNREVSVPGYRLALLNLPLVATLEAKSDIPLLRRAGDATSTVSHRMVGGAHLAGENRAMIIVRVDNQRNPGDGYWMVREVTMKSGSTQSIDLSFDQFQRIQAVDP